MAASKGFTLIEIIIILTIIGISAMIAIPYLVVSAEQTKAQVAKNNLLAISAAQQKYFEDNGTYCISDNGVCNSSASTSTNLSLGISDNYFTYTCNKNPFGSVGYVCYATNNSDPDFLLTLKPVVVGSDLVGTGVTCQNSNNPGYCPS